MAFSSLFWPPLLFRQICILAGVLGLLCLRHPAPALLGLLLLWLLDWPRSRSSAPALGLALSFGLGLGYAWVTEPPRVLPEPAWVTEAVTPSEDKNSPYHKGVRLSGSIREVTPLPDERLRLILDRVRPEEDAPLPPLPDGLVLTWRKPAAPLSLAGPGQRLYARLRIRAVRAPANPGVWETDAYWRDSSVRYRAWNQGGGRDGPPRLEGEPSAFWAARQKVYEAVLRLLPRGKSPEKGPDAGPNSAPDSSDAAPTPEAPPLTSSAAILTALLFGDRSFLTQEQLTLVAKSTLAHSLALSGLHLGYATALGYGVAALLGLLLPTLFLRIPRPRLGLALALPFACAYLWLGAAPPSLLRSALMLLFWAWLLWRHKPKALLDGLIWAVALILLVSPTSLYDIRLQLSALAVASIALIAPLLSALLFPSPSAPAPPISRFAPILRHMRGLLRVALSLLAVSVATQTALLPLTADAFTSTGLWFPLNLLWLPVLGAFVMPLAFAGLFFAACSWALPATLCFELAARPCAWLLDLLAWMNGAGVLYAPATQRPHWICAVGFWLLLLCLPPLIMRRAFTQRLALLSLCGFLLLTAPTALRFLEEQADTTRLRLMDVGQGQAVVLEWRGGGRLLIDGGGFASGAFDAGRHILAPTLTDNRPPELDWMLNTHADLDHLRGLLDLLDRFRVGAFGRAAADPGQGRDAEERDRLLAARRVPLRPLQAGDSIPLGPNLRLDLLHPPESGSASSNNNSLVLRLVQRLARGDKGLALICGDVEAPGLRRLRASGRPLKAEVLILPHHGSASGLDRALYDAVRPKVALVSCGYGNQWNFPVPKVRAALTGKDIPLRSTADWGQIAVEWAGNGEMRPVELTRERGVGAKTP